MFRQSFFSVLLSGFFLLLALQVQATHGIAGDLTYRYLGGNSFEITLITYSNPCDAGVDDCEALFLFYSDLGGGSFVALPTLTVTAQRVNGINGLCDGINRPLGDTLRFINSNLCIKKNIYRANVTFPGPGNYQVRYAEFSRLSGITNMSASDNVWWYFSSNIILSSFITNNSVRLNNQPIDFACVGELWTHNPAAVDPDGDSLVYSLVNPQQWDPGFAGINPTSVPNYRYPNDPAFGISTFTINPQTGLIRWENPTQGGIFAIAIKVEEYRGGTKVGEVIRDMAIFVDDVCTNRPPQIESIEDTCIKPLQELRFEILSRDPDASDSVYFYLSDAFDPIASAGGIFDPARPAGGVARLVPPDDWLLLPQLTGLMSGPAEPPPSEYPVVTELIWTPECIDMSSSSYQVNLYAHDRLAQPAGVTLSTDKIILIDVIGPPVTGVTAVGIGNQSIEVRWRQPACPNVDAYQIYRAPDSLAVPVDSCCTDNPGAGYELIGTNAPGDTVFINGPGLPFSGKFCYRVVPIYSTGFGLVMGCPSEQVCVEQQLEAPQFLQVDVSTTSATNGTIDLAWRQPPVLDSSFYTPPFEYRLFQATGVTGNAFAEIAVIPDISDTSFTVSPLNTLDNGYNYRLDVYDADGNYVISSAPASSVYLDPEGTETAINVRFDVAVPWGNDTYELYRSESGIGGVYTLVTTQRIASPSQSSFTFVDNNVSPGIDYCYYVRTNGRWRNAEVSTDTTRNRSNRNCARIVDLEPPCSLPASLACDPSGTSVTLTVLEAPDSCGSDIDFYVVRLEGSSGVTILDTLDINPLTTYPITVTYTSLEIPNLAGCLTFQPVDLSGNVGEPANRVCISDECPLFLMPNVFTPNGDGQNDIFRPLQYDPDTGLPIITRGVIRIECVIFDRTGRRLHSSTDINNLWDGTVNGAKAPAGQYFYYLNVVLDSLENPRRLERTGSVTLLR